MGLTELEPERNTRAGSSFAYLMTGIALGSICVGWILGSIFTPDMVTGSSHQHFPAAFTAWIWAAIAIGMVVPVAMQGIRADVTDRAPWILLGLGVGATWILGTVVAIFAPVWVTGTDPDYFPAGALLAAIAELILTGILCNFVKTASFQPAESKGPFATTIGPESAADDVTVKLRRLAQLRDSGAVTDSEFQAKKSDLLTRL